jgi:peptidylprolyl isomerase
MNRVQRIGCLAALMMVPAFFTAVCAEEKAPSAQLKETKKLTKEEVFSPENITRISESYGHFIYKSLDNPILKLDFAGVIKGLNDAKAGKPSPMTEQEYEEGIAAIQEIAFQEMAEKNLKDAEAFLAKNGKESGIVELEKGKLQIKIVQPGSGEELTEGKMPVLHYTGKYLDGTVFGNSYTNGEPISISLAHTIPGFRQGVMGMKVGEKRQIFIHPSLGYGTSGQLLPNALLIFDIELVKVDQAPKEEADDSASDDEADDDEDIDDSDDDFDDDNDDDDDDSVIMQPKK